jgi:hypothetical protein
MADQTTAASSPAEVDVFAGKELSFEEFSRRRNSPEKYKSAEPAETAPADAPKEAQSEGDEPESAGEPEAPKETQEKKPHLTAEQRVSQLKATIEKIWSQDEPDTVKIAQLEATIDKIEARSGAKQRKTEPAPVAQPPQVQAQPQYTRPKPTSEDRNPDGSAKYGTYEDFVEELADWKAEQRWASLQRESAAQAQAQNLAAKAEATRTRYADFDEVKEAFTGRLMDNNGNPKIPVPVLAMLSDSEVLTDLIYAIGSDDKEASKFIQMARTDPRAAQRYIALKEASIIDDLSGKAKPKEAPAPPKTQAPKPPSPVSGSSSRTFDPSDNSIPFKDWARKRTEAERRKGRG